VPRAATSVSADFGIGDYRGGILRQRGEAATEVGCPGDHGLQEIQLLRGQAVAIEDQAQPTLGEALLNYLGDGGGADLEIARDVLLRHVALRVH